MKNSTLRSCLLLLLSLFFFAPANATHFAGGEITVQHITGNTYQVTLKLYRDCAGINFGSTQQIQLSPTNSGSVFSLQRISVTDITPLCPGFVSRCAGGSTPGVEEHLYRGNVTLNQLPMGQVYTLIHRSCCRTNAITTFSQPGNTGYQLVTTVDPNQTPRNSSPVFLNDPVVYLCAGQTSVISPNASDPDGDVLLYSLTTPLNQGGTPVNFFAGYSFTNPLSTTSGISLNPNTGQITLTPNAVQYGVLAIKVEEFRNGIKIGEVTRDINVIVQNCNNGLPTASGVNGTNNYSISTCPGQTVSFNVNSADPDNDGTQLIYNNAIPGGIFTTNGATNESGTFTWTPSLSQTGSYNFSITVRDDACPAPGQNSYTFTVNVGNPNSTLTVNDAVCGGTGSASIATDTSSSSITWSTGATGPSVSGLAPGNYSVIVAQGTCADTTSFTVQSAGAPVSITDSVWDGPCIDSCGRGIFLSASSAPGATFTAQWSDGASGLSRTNLCPGSYSVTVTDNNGCSATRSYLISPYSPLSASVAITDHDCSQAGFNGSAVVTPAGGTGLYNILWSTGSTRNAQYNLAPGTYSFTITSRD